jgi:protein-disulfide isomerase
MKKFYYVLGAVAVIGVALVGYSVGSNTLGMAVSEPVEIEGLDDMETLVALAQGVTKGDADAPITIVEFADYQCPGCGAFALSVKPQVDLTYIETGKAKFVYYDFPLISIHAHAFLAARAGRCADDQGKFWEYQNELFRNQPTWAADQSPMGRFLDYGEAVGVDMDTFESCVKSDRHADVVSANMRLGYELGVDGTPTIMISQGRGMARRLNNFDFQSIQTVVEEFMAAAEAEAPTGN